MKTANIVIGLATLLAANPVFALGFYCSSPCMLVDYDIGKVELFGQTPMEGTSTFSAQEAFDEAQSECSRISDEKGALVKNVDIYRRDQSSDEWTIYRRYSFERGRSFSRRSDQAESRSSTRDQNFKLDVNYASPLDPEVCGPMKVKPKKKNQYEGSENPLG